MRIGIVTGAHTPDLTDDDRTLVAALEVRGHTVEPVIWDEDPVAPFDCLVCRSCWHYYERLEAFLDWLERATREATVLNPPPVIRWNVHKGYLRQLAAAGVPVLPTAWLSRGSEADLAALCAERGWAEAVVKPAVGTSAHGVWRTSAVAEPQARLEAALTEGDQLVQAYAPEITDGELSLVYAGGQFSHANRTIPAAGDYRAHPDFGGTSEPATPAEETVATGREIVRTAAACCGLEPDQIVYARVDGLERPDGFALVELELIEPYLGLSRSDGAPERLATAIESAI